jgi:hypothetical protein
LAESIEFVFIFPEHTGLTLLLCFRQAVMEDVALLVAFWILSKEPTMHRHRAVQVDHLQTQFASFVK